MAEEMEISPEYSRWMAEVGWAIERMAGERWDWYGKVYPELMAARSKERLAPKSLEQYEAVVRRARAYWAEVEQQVAEDTLQEEQEEMARLAAEGRLGKRQGALFEQDEAFEENEALEEDTGKETRSRRRWGRRKE